MASKIETDEVDVDEIDLTACIICGEHGEDVCTTCAVEHGRWYL